MLRITFFLFALLSLTALTAQMTDEEGRVTYGDEWINEAATYVKIGVAQDGMYRVTPEQLRAVGLSFSAGNQYKLETRGAAVPLRVDDAGIVFYGQANDGGLDKYLFEDAASMQLNPRYSMYNDTAVYYLSEAAGAVAYETVDLRGGTPLSEITRTSEAVFSAAYSKTFFRSSGISLYYSHYDVAEGYGMRSSNDLLSANGTTETAIDLDLPGGVNGTATLRMRYGLGFDVHDQDIQVNGQSVGGFEGRLWSVEQLEATFSTAGETAAIRLIGSGGDRDKANVAWAEVSYPAAPSLPGLRSFMAPASAQNQLLRLTDVGADAGAMQLVNPGTGEWIPGRAGGGDIVEFTLPPASQDQRYHVVSTATTLTPAVLTGGVRLSRHIPEGSSLNYVILSSKRLAGPELDALAAYRRSPAGGSYNVQVTMVEDLYDSYAFGVDRHPIALRNYLEKLRRAHPQLQYLFLIGKGRELSQVRTNEQAPALQTTFFIPSFGFPASDNLLTAPVGGVVPTLSTGRLSAITGEEIGIYLDKLRGVEAQINLGEQTIADRAWMKRLLHLGGGGSAAEQNTIRNNLNQLKNTIEDSRLGGDVKSFFKTSSEPIETSQQDAIFDIINGGTSIITFYGHSSSNGFEFSIDDPDNYENTDRYPYMVSLGCYSGDAFTAARSISERFIFLPGKGAVAFAASKGVGFISALRLWGNQLYEHTGGAYYGQGIGDVMRATIESFSTTSSFTTRLLTHQFALSGDPAYRLHPRPGPDVVVDAHSVSFSPEVIPAQELTFDVSYRVVNLGQGGGEDSITVRFSQELPSGAVQELATERILTPHFDGIFTTTLPNVGLDAVGRNRVFISIDSDEELAELPRPAAEDNNNLVQGGREGVEVTVIANTARVAYPPEFAVVSAPPTLYASTTDALAPEREYIVQVSERVDFADLIHEERITAPGGIIRTQPSISYGDSTTYYWRISPDSLYTEGAGFIWSASSFTHVNAPEAEVAEWAQQDPGQFARGAFENIRADSIEAGWSFAQTVTDVRIFNGIYEGRNFPRFMRNQQRLNSPFNWTIRSGMSVMVIDSINFSKWYPNLGNGEYGTRPIRTSTWRFETDTREGRRNMMAFLNEGIPEGRYVIIWSLQRGADLDYYGDDWLEDEQALGTTLFDALEAEGAIQIRSLATAGAVPYALAFQKGLGLISEVIAEEVTDQIELRVPVRSNWERGSWSSAPVGPAKAWSGLQLSIDAPDVEAADSIWVNITGYDNEGGDAVVLRAFDFPLETSLDYQVDLSDIDAGQYPELSVTVEFFDDDLRTAPTVKHLYFSYDPLPDVAVNPAVSLTIPDSLQRGEPGNVSIGFENISATDMDSLLVELQVIDRENNVLLRRKRTAPLPANTTGSVDFALETESALTDFRVQAILNPNQDQPEDVTFNNILTRSVKINQDQIDPVVSVFFDGRQIFDGELISGQPEISIQVRDENTYLPLNDTAAYDLRLEAPNGESERISFNDPRVEFIPAATEENLAEIFFRPQLIQDGTYTLTLSGKDRSNNATGRYSYQKSFEVVNQVSISNVLTYPNPFTTETRFVYTLTGSQPPSVFRIQIMTVSGRVVRDIDLLATETLKVGTHRTDFTWDGTDEYGDLLANGVYLYRVITADAAGNTMEKFDTGTDQYFKNGLGKVVILR